MCVLTVSVCVWILFHASAAEDELTTGSPSELLVQCFCLNNSRCSQSCSAEKCFFASLTPDNDTRSDIYGCIRDSQVIIDQFHRTINVLSPCPSEIVFPGVGVVFLRCCNSKDFCNTVQSDVLGSSSSEARSLQETVNTGTYNNRYSLSLQFACTVS